MAKRILLPDEPITDLAAYRDIGGGAGIERARSLGPGAVVAEIRESGLRGRGGAGFPTHVKWSGLAEAGARRSYVVCNAAEGEPGTYKDRHLMRMNPYRVIEGIAIAAFATGSERAFIGTKAKFTAEIEALTGALAEMAPAGLAGDIPIEIVPGPDDYLFGEEKAMLEVIEGNDPLPRLHPPYVQGLFETPGGPAQPAVVNNVETLSNVPLILARGAKWFRSFGTEESPGTMVFTVCGDVATEAVVELEMGTPLSILVYVAGGGVGEGRAPKLMVSGVSNAPLTVADIDAPLSFEGLRSVGSGLGSGGFAVYDDTRCAVQIGATLSAFLLAGSCGQCPPCKLGTEALTERFTSLTLGTGTEAQIGEVAAWILRVTDSNRCGLGAGQQALARGILERFPDDLAHHIGGGVCPADRVVAPPIIESWDQGAMRFTFAAPPRT
ncbi:MAG: hypothetical protein HKN01_01810 [Acidimicrobiia bacterium]|nr:hypothetical protein [Acidimicrobiia bacterium]